MNEIVMPKLSDTMTEGRLVSWKKRVGEEVRRGDVLAEVETDKANMELEAFVSGELLEVRVQPGEMVAVGTVIAVIGTAGEKGGEGEKAAGPEGGAETPPSPPKGAGEGPAAAKADEAAPVPEEGAKEPAEAADIEQPQTEKQAPAAAPLPGAVEKNQHVSQPGQAPTTGPIGVGGAPGGKRPEEISEAGEGRERAAPVVRRRARELGIDLSRVKGSGPDGRILLEDLEESGKGGRAEQAQPQPPQEGFRPRLVKGGATPMSRLRAAVARTVAESWKNIPHFTVTMEIVMDEAEAVRRQLKQSGMHVTVNDIIVKAVALSLQKYPQLNASYAQDGILYHNDVNIAVAVGVPDGVLMPVLPRCQSLSLLEIAQEAARLVEHARSGHLTDKEMNGGTFSVSNLGMFSVDSFSAVIHPAQAAVLAVGAVADNAMVRGGVLATAKTMKVTLSADHRVVDGAYAAQFLAELKSVLESPVRLLI